MCGICGKLVFNNIAPTRDLIASMCDTIIHRGPDDAGIYTNSYVGLGQRRLSIIDLNTSACPPLSNEDDTIWLAFNGEIYNFLELRKDLIDKGHIFKTKTDTEVIIHLYEEMGFDCLVKLRGMFAFSLWDAKLQILFCARDRVGKKPFCYTITPNSLIFGSEIKAITKDPEVTISPNYGAIDLYLTHQFVPSPYTAFDGIFRLGAGEYLVCDLKGKAEIKTYWEPPIQPVTLRSEAEIEEEILVQLRESVGLRMIADVPLGAFLSGGIDSATIVALMAEQSSRPINTFSIGFEDEKFDELPYARLLAEKYGTNHHEMIVKPDAKDIIPILVKHYNEPFADSSAIPTYYVSKMTRQHVTVALSGDGGDESFAGYENYKVLQKWNQWNVLPLPLRKIFLSGGRGILGLLPDNNNVAKFERGLSMIEASNIKERRLRYGTILKDDEKRQAYTDKFRELISKQDIKDPLAEYPWREGMDELDWLMRHDQSFYLPDCLMVKSDIASMANSLEVRSPFLDHKFIEFAASIPSSYKLNEKGGKAILKSAVRKLLPPETMLKPKTGFGVPLASWFRNELSPLLEDTLLDGRCAGRGLFSPDFLKKMVSEHKSGVKDWSNRLWAFLFLELWFREFID